MRKGWRREEAVSGLRSVGKKLKKRESMWKKQRKDFYKEREVSVESGKREVREEIERWLKETDIEI